MRRAAAFALPALLLAGCAAASQAPAQTDALTIENRYPLEYAKQFTVDVCAGGYDLITIDGSRYLVVPEGAAAPANLDADITVLQQPIQNIYLVSSSAMDPIISIGGLGAVALSGTQAENWYLDAARTAMEQGEIAYAGKYSAPDYETILSADCGLAIENTMIYHTPEVKEQLEKFGVPYEMHIYSAHRTPGEARAFADSARERGFGAIIAAAGMAAHLAGALAAATTLPVIGIPVASALGGMDALLATVQMPSGIPVATVAIDGAKNAAYLAVQILAVMEPALAEALAADRAATAENILAADAALEVGK